MPCLHDKRLLTGAALALVLAATDVQPAAARDSWIEETGQVGLGRSLPARVPLVVGREDLRSAEPRQDKAGLWRLASSPSLTFAQLPSYTEPAADLESVSERPLIALPEVRPGPMPALDVATKKDETAPDLAAKKDDAPAELAAKKPEADEPAVVLGSVHSDQPRSISVAAKVDEEPARAADIERPIIVDIAPAEALANDITLPGVWRSLLAGLPEADIAVAEQLRELLASADRTVERRQDRAAVQAFYLSRGYAPLWITEGRMNAKADSTARRLRAAEDDGLSSADYAIPDFKEGAAEALAAAEIKLTAAALNYARHAQIGRVMPLRISNNMDYRPQPMDPAEVLRTLADATDMAAALDSFNPPHAGFRALRAKLIEARGGSRDGAVRISSGPSLKVGAEDDRVPLLRQRLSVSENKDSSVYDAELADAVRAFQRRSRIKADGVLNARTVDLLNGGTKDRQIETMVSNLERWRWLPRDLGKTHVMVNVPDYTLKVFRDGDVVFRTRIVAGKPQTPTPIFSDVIENIVVNPTWHVPQSIIQNEYLPALAEDPTILARMGLVVERTRNGVIVRQPPGEKNALGRMKFNFPNRHQVYLHDTPQKHLFAHERRAYSHGCMRVQNPAQFGEVLLASALPREGYTAERLTRMFGTGERSLKFQNRVDVHLTYMNAYVDEAGKLVIRDDIYGYDSRVASALRSSEERRIADASQSPPPRREAVRDIVREERSASRAERASARAERASAREDRNVVREENSSTRRPPRNVRRSAAAPAQQRVVQQPQSGLGAFLQRLFQ